MEDDKCGGGSGNSSRNSPAFVKTGDRQIFSVELRPGETTIVSWKKLAKDVNKVTAPNPASESPVIALPALQPQTASGQPTETELNDAPQPNRISAVIEKIERLYMGKDSSDEEEILPDDDQYDTEDSFIDDAELDEYFEVDNSAIRHEGFFVNRGKLERLNEPLTVSNQQPKKRRRKDLGKDNAENDNGGPSNKQVKVWKATSGKTEELVTKNFSNPSQSMGASQEIFEDLKLQSQLNPSGLHPRKKSADTKTVAGPSSVKTYNGSNSTYMAGRKDIDQQQTGVILSKSLNNQPKESIRPSDDSHKKFHDRSGYVSSKLQSGRSLNNSEELESCKMEASIQPKEKNAIHELPGVRLPEANYPSSTKLTKSSNMLKKDGSSVRPKSSMLERAIRELEKMVAESRPPAMENNEAEAIKRRLPREIKLKLAKVARLAACHGKISKELINRLMSILGHLMQLRTLKRNLKVMISTSLSAKQEQNNRFQQIKREVVEMIKLRPSSLEVKAVEKQAAASDDVKELGSDEKGVPKRKFSIEAVLEDKICDLYDLFLDGIDEDAGPQVRKLYVELAELWPSGFMDKHGIKRAICRAKERRRALYNRHKEQEKMKGKKMLGVKTEESVRVDSDSVAHPQHARDRLPSELSTHSLLASTKQVSITSNTSSRISSPSKNTANSFERPKQEKSKGTSSSYIEDARAESTSMKKKVKRKPEAESDEVRARAEKVALQAGDEKSKSAKQSSGHPHKLNLQPTVAPGLQQSS